MWVHHATVNRLRMSWPDKTEGNSVFGSVLRVSSITLSVLFNFLGIPAFALIIAPNDTNAWIIILDSLLISMIFFGI